jgi:hypothetical protein
MTDTGLYDLDDCRELSNLPLSDDGIFGSERRKIKHDLLPEFPKQNWGKYGSVRINIIGL